MNASAQNAMLKLLEEGPAYAVFLLLAENGGGLLRTVRSRCEGARSGPGFSRRGGGLAAGAFPGKSREELEQAAGECQGILGRAVDLLEGGGEAAQERRQQAEKLVRALEGGDELAPF